MRTIPQVAKEVNKSRSAVQFWCKNNKVTKFKGAYYMNPLQVEMYKAQMNKVSDKVQKTSNDIKEYNQKRYQAMKNIELTDKEKIARKKANRNYYVNNKEHRMEYQKAYRSKKKDEQKIAKELSLKEQVLKPIVSNSVMLRQRIEKLKLLVEVAELDLLKDSIMEQINKLENV